MRVYLVHHGEAVAPDVDVRRPLSAAGRRHVEALAADAAARGVAPAAFWHSGKLRAKQTAEVFWRVCNPLAPLAATRDLQPGDPPLWMRDRLRFDARDLLIAGHYPHLPRLFNLLVTGRDATDRDFPLHGLVALESVDEGESWQELWRTAGGR
jgi:phosphohistidine phosphatase